MLKKLVNAKAKDFVNSKAKEWFGADKSPNQVNSAQAGSKADQITSPSLGTVEQKPFKINLNELWQYDYEELSDFIPQYEEYITFLRQKCHEAMDRYFAAEEQIEQLKQEKSVPTDRADRTRQQTGDLLDAVTPTALSPSFTKEKSEFDMKPLEEIIAEKMKFIYVDENLLLNLKETASKTVEQLVEIRNILFSNTSQIVGMQLQENNHENPDYVDLLSDNPNPNAAFNQAGTADQFVDFKIRGTTRDEVINLIGDIEMTTQLVFPKFTDINNKLKSQEKLIIKEINQAFSNLKKTKSESLNEVTSPEISQISRVSEGELAEIRTQLETTKSKLIEVEKRNHGMSIQIVDISAREESYKQEVKNLNVKIGDLEKKIKEGENNLKKADSTIKERENKLQQADTKYKQLETKVKEMEGKVKEGEKTKKEMENKLKETENRTNELEAKLIESENKIKDTLVKLKNAQDQKEELANQFGWLKREHQDLISSKEKVEGESSEEVTKLQDRIFFLENDNVRLKEKAIEAEQSKTDLENKVIQERLKHHQTIGDMQKLGESLKEAEKHLDNEVEAHKAVVHKNESLKKKLAENDKKMLDYKKTIKRLSQQVLDLHNKINDSNRRAVIVSPVNNVIEKVEEIEERADTENVLECLQMEDLDQELKEKGRLIAQQAEKIQALLGKLEEAVQESLAVKKDNEELKKEKETLRSQNKVLQDKRESGLLEIQRLNNAIDRLKEKYPDIGTNLVQPIVPKGIADKITSPVKIEEPLQSPPLMKHSSSSIASPMETSGQKKLHQPSRSISIVTSPTSKSSMPGTSQISAMKRNLDTLYKEVILALTSEKLNAKKGSNATSAPGEKSIEEELGESLVKIEKKVNDTILLLQDYIEVITKAWKSES